MNKSENIYGKDWIFVGNSGSVEEDKEKFMSNGIKFVFGKIAYDIHGNKIPSDYMLPLFIAKESYQKYDSIMMAELRAIRRG